MMEKRRKIIQISAASPALYALTDDGLVWATSDLNTWTVVPDVPQGELPTPDALREAVEEALKLITRITVEDVTLEESIEVRTKLRRALGYRHP